MGVSKALKAVVYLTTFGLSLSAFAGKNQKYPSSYKIPVKANEFKVMSYNVENLFDSEHDEGKIDYEYLPLTDPLKQHCSQSSKHYQKKCFETNWTDKKVDLKISQIRRVVSAQGDLPDILILSEVENAQVIRRLATALGYRDFVMSDSPDRRGIDLAILYRQEKLEFVSSAEKGVSVEGLLTRNLLVANFRLKKALTSGEIIGVFANHWPSQAKPTAARVQVAQDLLGFVDEQSRIFGKAHYSVIVAGDFNTLKTESPNPIDDIVLKSKSGFGFKDVHEEAINDNNKYLKIMPPSTYFFPRTQSWNELDHIMVSGDLRDGRGLEMDPQSFRIVGTNFMSSPEGTPVRYNHQANTAAAAGFSDHYPIVVKFTVK